MFAFLLILSILVFVLAFFNLVPAMLAYSLDMHDQSADFLLISAVGIFISICVFIALRNTKLRIDRVRSFAIVSICWLLLPVIGAIPVKVVAGLSLVDSYFESVSGFTTTGSTVLLSQIEFGRPLLLWRSLLQWLGGLFTLLCIVLVLAPCRIGGLPDRFIRFMDINSDLSDPRVLGAVRRVSVTYSVLTGFCLLVLMICGVDWFTAVCLSLATLSTGGFIPFDGDLSLLGNWLAEIVLIFFMLIGGTSIFWHRMLLQPRTQQALKHRESYYLIAASLFLGVVVAFLIYQLEDSRNVLSQITALREGVFTAVSLVTTTGFNVHHEGFAVLPLLVVIFMMLVGGGTFSTAGGLKFYRIGGMFVQAIRELVRLVYPHGIRSSYFGSQQYDLELMKAIWSMLVVTILVIAAGSIALAFDNIDYMSALTAATANFANIGTVYSSGWILNEKSEWLAYAELSDFSKITLGLLMIFGRLEVLIVFGAFGRLMRIK